MSKDEAMTMLAEWTRLADSYRDASLREQHGAKAAEFSRIAAAYEHCIDSVRVMFGLIKLYGG